MPLQASAQHSLLCFFMSHCLSDCPNVLCQHGLFCRAGESITHMRKRRHHLIAPGLTLCSFCPTFIMELVLHTDELLDTMCTVQSFYRLMCFHLMYNQNALYQYMQTSGYC